MSALAAAETHEAVKPTTKATAAQVRRSIKPDGLISFEDGKTYKVLRRHLGQYGLTPEAYREKWGLPADYPVVAPEYAARRSELAKSLGLGRGGRAANDAAATIQIDADQAEAADMAEVERQTLAELDRFSPEAVLKGWLNVASEGSGSVQEAFTKLFQPNFGMDQASTKRGTKK